MFGFLTFALYLTVLLVRTLDPTAKVIKLNGWIFLGLVTLALGVGWINIIKDHNYLFVPLTILLFIEVAISIWYWRLKVTADDHAIYYVNDLYGAIALYLLIVPTSTIIGVVYMLCTS